MTKIGSSIWTLSNRILNPCSLSLWWGFSAFFSCRTTLAFTSTTKQRGELSFFSLYWVLILFTHSTGDSRRNNSISWFVHCKIQWLGIKQAKSFMSQVSYMEEQHFSFLEFLAELLGKLQVKHEQKNSVF